MKKLSLNLLLCLFSLPLWASENLVLTPSMDTIPLNDYIEIFEDHEGNLTFSDILSEPIASQFHPHQKPSLNFGYTSTVYWVRLKLDNILKQPDHWKLVLSFSGIDFLTFYQQGKSVSKTVETGAMYPFSQRDLWDRHFVFSMLQIPDEPQTIHLRIETDTLMTIPLTLRSSESYNKVVQQEQIMLGIYYGLVLVMILYNFILFLTVKDISYLYYVMFIGSYGFLMLAVNGLAYQHLWGNFPLWNKYFWLLINGVYLFIALQFNRTFLDTKKNLPKTDKLIIINMGIVLLQLLTYFYGSYEFSYMVIVLVVALSSIISMSAAFLSFRKGFIPARYYLIGWAIIILGGISNMLLGVGWLPVNFFTQHGMQICSALEMVLFALALADRINVLRQEKIVIQQEALAALHRSDLIKDEFLAHTSHELRTPLHGIIGMCNVLRQELGQVLTPEQSYTFKMITESSSRLSRQVNDILDYSKMNQEELKLERQPTDLRKVSEEVIAFSRTQLPPDVHLINQVPQFIPVVCADVDRLRQIMYNLIGNAIKFTREGTVKVSAKPEGEHVLVTISDTGIGIPKNRQEVIFEPYSQFDRETEHRHGGTGIGLAVTKKLVEMHGSSIKVRSQEGVGSLFSFRLPQAACMDEEVEDNEMCHSCKTQSDFALTSKLKKEEIVSPKLLSSEKLLQGIEYDFSAAKVPPNKVDTSILVGKKILLVDDDNVNMMVLENIIKSMRCITYQAFDGKQALKLLEEHSPDLILLDLMMPGMSGYEVCRHIRKNITLAELPVIVLTARNNLEDYIEAMRCGANDYLTKPFYQEELQARIAAQLQMAESERLKSEIIQRREKEADLLVFQNQLLYMLDLADEVILATNENQQIIFFNQKAEVLLGYSKQEVQNQQLSRFIPNLDVSKLKLENVGSQELELEIQNKNRTFFPARVSVSTLETDQENAYVIMLDPEHVFEVEAENSLNYKNIFSEMVDYLSQNGIKLDDAVAKLEQENKLQLDMQQNSEKYKKRILVVNTVNLVILYWEKVSGKNKIELAEESGLWSIDTNRSTLRARTLDRYLNLETLPTYPRYSVVIQTLRFVLAYQTPSEEHWELRDRLEEDLQQLEDMMLT